jgi:hypothetical protein
MAGLIAYLNIPKTTLVAATAKTIAQLTAPTNQRLKILEIGVFFDSISTTPGSSQLRVIKQTSAGTMTAQAPVASEPELTETIQATGAVNASAEPTNAGATAVIMTPAVPITSGLVYPFPPGQELYVGGAGRLGFEVTLPTGASASAYGYIKYEE